MKKVTLEHAKEVAERLKKKFKHGKTGQPEWFKNATTHMEQDGSYGVSICIPDWNAVPADYTLAFLEPVEDVRVFFRVVKAPNNNYNKKQDENDETKKRRSNR